MINKTEEKEGRHTLAITRQDLVILKYLFWFLSNICWVWNYRSWLFFFQGLHLRESSICFHYVFLYSEGGQGVAKIRGRTSVRVIAHSVSWKDGYLKQGTLLFSTDSFCSYCSSTGQGEKHDPWKKKHSYRRICWFPGKLSPLGPNFSLSVCLFVPLFVSRC